MIVKLFCDEWYPVYSMETSPDYYGYELDLPEDEVARIERVFKEFNEVQDILKDCFSFLCNKLSELIENEKRFSFKGSDF